MMKKKLLLLTVVICAFMLLGSASVFAADAGSVNGSRQYTVVCEEVGNDAAETTIGLSDYWELSDEQIYDALDYLGVPYELNGMIYQTYNSSNDSIVCLEFYYGNTVVARANVNRFNGSVTGNVKMYTPAAFRMDDVAPGDWYYEAVKFNYDYALMMGVDLTHFLPNDSTTRGMLVTILYRMEGKPAVSGYNSFRDVKSGDWFHDAVIWASENGIVYGVGDGKFAPNDDITREQLATMLYRYADYLGLDVSARGNLGHFADYRQTSFYAVEPVCWAYGVGLINGMGDNILAPQATATRAQMATMIYRFCQ